MKKKPFLFSKHAYLYMLANLILCGCGQQGQTSETYERSDYYTRGIGQYPGSPDEDFSPHLRPDYDTYRNIAKLRTAYHSSSYDYNLTAQLVTDGIITDQEPKYITISTPEGKMAKRESEWSLDNGPYSRNTILGENTYVLFSLANWSAKADEIRLSGNVVFNNDQAKEGYEIICQGSNDGTNWTELGKLSGKDLPGKPIRFRMHSDPNKVTKQAVSPVRMLKETIPFHTTGEYAQYRLVLNMKGAINWGFTAIDFFQQGEQVNLLPSQFFSSTWMSAGNAEEWVYVDLGSRSEFDKINLHWIHKANLGKIQISDDAQTWTDIAVLPGGDAKLDEISCSGKARYVRVYMQQPANGQNYLLSEMEVMGKGGLVAHPLPQPQAEGNTFTLSGGNWMLQRASAVTEGGESISKPGFCTSNWIAATVPGTVLTSYKNIGAVPNPNYADNIFHISESFFNSNFWYRNEFEVPEGFKQERLFLNFDGINWKANVYLNGTKLGLIEGAFIRGMYDVTDCIVPGKNVLAVEIVKNLHIGAVKEKYEKNTDFNGGILGADNPTFHASIGWDWISTIRGRNIGIYNDVYLTTVGKVTIQDPFVQTALALPDTTATLTPEIIVKNHEKTAVKGILSGKVGDISFEQPVELAANEEKTVRFNPGEFTQLKDQHLRL